MAALNTHARLLEAAQLLDLKQPVVLLKDAAMVDVHAVLTVYVGPRENPSGSREFVAHNPTSLKIDSLCGQALDFLHEYYAGDSSKMRHLTEPIRPSKSAWAQVAKQTQRNYYTAMEGTTALHIMAYNYARELERLKIKHDHEIGPESHESPSTEVENLELKEMRGVVESKKQYLKELEVSIAAYGGQLYSMVPDHEGGDGSGSDTSESTF